MGARNTLDDALVQFAEGNTTVTYHCLNEATAIWLARALTAARAGAIRAARPSSTNPGASGTTPYDDIIVRRAGNKVFLYPSIDAAIQEGAMP